MFAAIIAALIFLALLALTGNMHKVVADETCPECGNAVPRHDDHCRECGAELDF